MKINTKKIPTDSKLLSNIKRKIIQLYTNIYKCMRNFSNLNIIFVSKSILFCFFYFFFFSIDELLFENCRKGFRKLLFICKNFAEMYRFDFILDLGPFFLDVRAQMYRKVSQDQTDVAKIQAFPYKDKVVIYRRYFFLRQSIRFRSALSNNILKSKRKVDKLQQLMGYQGLGAPMVTSEDKILTNND